MEKQHECQHLHNYKFIIGMSYQVDYQYRPHQAQSHHLGLEVIQVMCSLM